MSIKNMELILSIFRSINNNYGYAKYAEGMLDILRCYTSREEYVQYLCSILKCAGEISTKVIILDVMHWNMVDDDLLKIFLIKAKSEGAPTILQSTIKEVDINRRNLQEIKWMFTTGQLDDQNDYSTYSSDNNSSSELQLRKPVRSLRSSRCILPVSSLQNIGSFLPWFASTEVDKWRLKYFTLTVKQAKQSRQ